MKDFDRQCLAEIRERLVGAGEWQYARGRIDAPVFRSAGLAASRLLDLVPADWRLLVMRDRSLRALRELLLERDRPLLIPDQPGELVAQVPRSALFDPEGKRHVTALTISPLPPGTVRYDGPLQAVVVACLAFDPAQTRLYSFDQERTAVILEQLRERGALAEDTPVIALAHDLQQVSGWSDSALGFVEAQAVVTPTRVVTLGQRF